MIVGCSASICRPCWFSEPERPSENLVVGKIGQDEESLASVRGAGVGRSYARPLRIEPVFGQVAEYSIEAERPVPGDVLQDRDSGS